MKPPFIKRAFIYRLGSIVACSPVSRYLSGGGIGTAEIFCCDTLAPVDIGRCLIDALERSVDGLSDQSMNPKDHRDAVLEATHAKSWRSLHANAKLVVAYKKPGSRKVKLTPTRAEGGSGSAHLDEKERYSIVVPSELGLAVLAALDDAE